jgi:MFS family permease
MPILGLALFGGAVADRLERKRLIQVRQLVATAIALVVGLSITAGTLTWYHLLGAASLQGIMWSFIAPA